LVRYLPLLAERKCKITFLAPAELIPLLRLSNEQIEIVSELSGVESFDFQVPLMSLPLAFDTQLEMFYKTGQAGDPIECFLSAASTSWQ
jgi:hypothetical protein